MGERLQEAGEGSRILEQAPNFGIDLSRSDRSQVEVVAEQAGIAPSEDVKTFSFALGKGLGKLEFSEAKDGTSLNVFHRENGSKLSMKGKYYPEDPLRGIFLDPKAPYEAPDPNYESPNGITDRKIDPRWVKLESNGGTITWEVQPDGNVLRTSSHNGISSKDILPNTQTNEGRELWKREIDSYSAEPMLSIEWRRPYEDDPSNPGQKGTSFRVRLPNADAQQEAQEKIIRGLKKLEAGWEYVRTLGGLLKK